MPSSSDAEASGKLHFVEKSQKLERTLRCLQSPSGLHRTGRQEQLLLPMHPDQPILERGSTVLLLLELSDILFCSLLWILYNITKVTTKSFQGYYWKPKIAKNGQKHHIRVFFARKVEDQFYYRQAYLFNTTSSHSFFCPPSGADCA